MKKFSTVLLLFVMFVFSAFSQEALTLQKAIEIALKNNFAITTSRLEGNISSTNNTIGNAGFLPSLTLNAAVSNSNTNTEQEFNSGASVKRDGAISDVISTGVALNWTIFDGLKMFATKQKLNELEAQGATNLKIEIENTIMEVITSYYDVVRQQQLIKATQEAIKIYDERIKIAQLKFDIGSASKLDVLQAKVDLNAQKSLLLKQSIALDNAKANLNQLLAKNSTADFTASDSIVVNYKPNYIDLQKNMNTKNNQLLYAQQNILIANAGVKELSSLALPQINLNLGYNFSQNKNQVGLILLNRNLGLNTGISASWTLFNGFKTHSQVKVAQLMAEQRKVFFQETTAVLEAALVKAFKAYENSLTALKLEEENTLIAKENVTIALERFRIGSSNSIELTTAQKSYEDALSRIVDARYEAKLYEAELMRLEGTLVK